MRSEELGDSTLGDLIAALIDETAHFVHDDREVYKVVAYMISDLLRSCKIALGESPEREAHAYDYGQPFSTHGNL